MIKKILVAVGCCLTLLGCEKQQKQVQMVKEEVIKPIIEFGFNLNDFHVLRDTIKTGDTFGKILAMNNVDATQIFEISEKAKPTFDPRRLKVGDAYTILLSKDSLKKPNAFIYQPSKIDYIVVNMADSVHAYAKKKPVKIVEREASGIITKSLSESILEAGMDYMVAHKLSQIYDYTVDFFRLQQGDKFKIIYEERFIDDTLYVGMGKIKAAYFEHKNHPFYAFNYVTDSIKNKSSFYDEKANMMRRMFLKAPLDFFRISSRFSPRRFHPVQKVWKAHKGTDYAAPHGTPIRATANGTIVKAGYTAGNGNYVKIRHNGTYETQYLHMSKILVKVGQYVAQGEEIGRVGSTGLATGPHVCYRFWKNGVQVDPLTHVMPASEPMNESMKGSYLEYVKPLKYRLDNIPYSEYTNQEEEQYITQL
ncbi:M23 family metallopeptidase [Imtechella halotolerans]|nr:peptidoglycan DD-metalloendopeptidase family protein [Imtechella halotolerans]WMQ62755.1 peptidoglycan DD-metalloendopeptidase family protein [Imtechella halotolerans]